jgi:hypothetical protein
MSSFSLRKYCVGMPRRCAWLSLTVGLMLLCGTGRADSVLPGLFEQGVTSGEPILLAKNSNNNNSADKRRQRQQDDDDRRARARAAQQQANEQPDAAADEHADEQQADAEENPLPATPAVALPPPLRADQLGDAPANIDPARLPPPPGQAAQQNSPEPLKPQRAPPTPPGGAPAGQAQKQSPIAVPVLVNRGPPPPVPNRNLRGNAAAQAAQQSPRQFAPPPAPGTGMQLPAEGPKINQWAAAPLVYNAQRVAPVTIDPGKAPQFSYQGQLHFDAKGNPSLDPNGRLVQPNGTAASVGGFLGGGANSKVYKSLSSADRVKKFVYLRGGNDAARLNRAAQTLTDQDAGRAMLSDIKQAMPDSPFRVAQRDGDLMTVKATDMAGNDHWFALSREENIATQVRVEDPSNPNFGNTVTVTNAADRVRLRANDQYGQKSLTAEEELTVNLVLRDLNQNGVVWTDHKLANFDIVPDATSATGYRMVFFDLDAFRPVRGGDRQQRYDSARELQRIFDSAPDMNTLQSQVTDFEKKNKRGAFDYTAFGGQNLGWLATPGANKDRQSYKALNFLSRENFAKAVSTFNAGNNKNAKYTAPVRSP